MRRPIWTYSVFVVYAVASCTLSPVKINTKNPGKSLMMNTTKFGVSKRGLGLAVHNPKDVDEGWLPREMTIK